MSKSLNWTIRILLVASLVVVASCGKKKEESDKTAGTTTHHAAATSLAPGDAPFASVVEAAGFDPVFYRSFPSQVPGMKSYVLVYRHGSSGGVLYLQQYGAEQRPVWHWYFDQDAPDSVAAVEINEDGLWDVRMFAGNKTTDYIQDQAFTFVARPRDDRVAMNGKSSDPVDADGMLWRAFDDDSTTAFRTSTSGAYVELPVPLGLDDGVLSVQLLGADQPMTVQVRADGKQIKEFDLDPTTSKQVIQLGQAALGAKLLRLDIKSARDGAANVAISELGVR